MLSRINIWDLHGEVVKEEDDDKKNYNDGIPTMLHDIGVLLILKTKKVRKQGIQ